MKLYQTLLLFVWAVPAAAQQPEQTLTYRAEAAVTVSNGEYAPLWLTANRYGMTSNESKNAYLRAGIAWNKPLKHDWRIAAGLDLAGGKNLISNFWIQQAYADVSWKKLTLSLGSKERNGFPLEKNPQLTTGWMTEGPNTRPIPQLRVEIKDFLDIPGLGHWLALKGHLAYGWFTDSNWQENFAGNNRYFTKGTKYHSKSLLFRLGNREKLPLEFEFGLIMATQFGGSKYFKNAQGEISKTMDMPDDLGAYWSAFFPQGGGSDTTEGEQKNVEGNMLGSWNFALNYYLNNWKFRVHLDHYFEDHSQMFWEYGRWKDGQLGIEITPPQNRWITSVVWEGFSTYDQTGPIQYEDRWGSFPGMQTSGADNYYNHGIYNAWQHYGMGTGNPLLPGPAYNADGSITFRSNRVKAQHIGLCGNPTDEWSWRVLATYARYWGTYGNPLDKVRKQAYTLAEVTYLPAWTKGWSVTLAGALDRGNYLGNSTGGSLTLRKTGSLLK